MKRLCRHRLALAVLAGLLGLALNAVPGEAVARLWLGRIATLPVAILFGPWFGILAAVIAAPSAYSINAGLLVVFGIEAVSVGALSRRGTPPLGVGAAMAALFALTLALFPGWYGMAHLQRSIAPLALQRLLSVMVAPVFADLISTKAAHVLVDASAPQRRRHLRAYFFHAFVVVAILPVLLVNTVSGEIFAAKQEAEGSARLGEMATALSNYVDSYLDTHVLATAALAATVGQPGEQRHDRQGLLHRYAAVYDGFTGLAFTDSTGLIREVEPPSSDGRSPRSVAEQDYFIEAVRSRHATISDIMMSETNSPAPEVFIAVPFLAAGGDVAGVAQASLSLTVFQYFVESYITLPNSTVTILDRHNRVIYASDGSRHRLQQDLTQDGLVRAADANASRKAFAYEYALSDGATAVQVATRTVVSLTGWTVFVEQPRVDMRLQAPSYYVWTIALMLLALVGAVLGARSFSGQVTRPLEELVRIVRGISAEGTPARSVLIANPPEEIASLVDDVNGMQSRLRDSYRNLEQALEERERLNGELHALSGELDQKVTERTAELADTNAVLQDMIRALPGALLVFDKKGFVRLFNDTAATLMERPWSDLVGLRMSQVFDTPDALPGTESAAADGNVGRAEMVIMTARGGRIPALVSTTALPDGVGSGSGYHTICIAIDIRDRKKLESELYQAQKLESVGRLAAGVAHEINTPIQFVSDSMQFIRDGMSDIEGVIQKYRALRAVVEEIPSCVDVASDAAQAESDADLDYVLEHVPRALDRSLDGLNRVATIVRAMKEFGHPNDKAMTSVDLNQAIRSTLVIARNEYKYVADVEMDLGEIPRVVCHQGDVNQVVLNLIVNAAHAIGDVVNGTDSKGRIDVRTHLDGENVVISISDTGGGIPDAICDHIFDPFFTTKGVGKGTGQGLAIARSVVIEKHGGALTFETKPGQGTTFFVSLPYSRTRSDKAAA